MSDRLFRARFLLRWLVYFMSSTLLSVVVYFTGYRGQPTSGSFDLAMLALALVLTLFLSYLLLGPQKGPTELSARKAKYVANDQHKPGKSTSDTVCT